ncbi:MAG: tRNA (guanosine(46)-N7)-methyltransferase TrmB [Planctomycetota bacterium]
MTRLRARKYALLEGTHLELNPADLAGGDWLRNFPGDGPLTVEIGVGKDPHLIEIAARNPAGRFVGLEYSRKKADMFLAKGLARGVENLRLVWADAFRALEPMFAEASVRKFFVLFPDPWPKKRHAKKRMVQPAMVATLTRKLEPDGILELRTDSALYAQQMLAVLEATPELTNELGPGMLSLAPRDPTEHVETTFERKFRELGQPIHYFYYRRLRTRTPR